VVASKCIMLMGELHLPCRIPPLSYVCLKNKDLLSLCGFFFGLSIAGTRLHLALAFMPSRESEIF
jgi:hypothetical protein